MSIMGSGCHFQNIDSNLSCFSQKYNYICSNKWQTKTKNTAKLNSTEMFFWRCWLKFQEEEKLGMWLLIKNECDKISFRLH